MARSSDAILPHPSPILCLACKSPTPPPLPPKKQAWLGPTSPPTRRQPPARIKVQTRAPPQAIPASPPCVSTPSCWVAGSLACGSLRHATDNAPSAAKIIKLRFGLTLCPNYRVPAPARRCLLLDRYLLQLAPISVHSETFCCAIASLPRAPPPISLFAARRHHRDGIIAGHPHPPTMG